MEALANQNPTIRLRRVDIDSWDSDVARQYRIQAVPTLWLYEDGKKVANDTRATAAYLQKL